MTCTPEELDTLPLFQWTGFDVNGMLPLNWRRDISAVAVAADFRDFPRTPGLSREADHVQHIPRGRVHANASNMACRGCIGCIGPASGSWPSALMAENKSPPRRMTATALS